MADNKILNNDIVEVTGAIAHGELRIGTHAVHSGYTGLWNTEASTTTTGQYLIISAGTDTYINGDSVYLRPGNNSSTNQLRVQTTGVTIGGNTVWHAGNLTPLAIGTTATTAMAGNTAFASTAQGTTADAALPRAAGSGNKLTDTLYIQGTNQTNQESVLVRGITSDGGDWLGSIRTANTGAYNQEMRFYTSNANGTSDENLTLTLHPAQSATFAGNLTVTGNQYFNGEFIEGDGKEIIRYSDAWLRINEDNDFSSGIYCGTGVLRTDGAFQIGGSGAKALITAAGAATFLGAVSASNFSGSSSGTNTGDQTLPTLSSLGGASSGYLTNTSGAKLEIQNGVDGGSGYGIYMWTTTDTNWGIYMATAGDGNSLSDGTASAGIDGRTSHGIRFRVANSTSQIGFLWENNLESALMQLTADTGNLLTKGNIYPSNQTTNYVDSTRIANWQTAYGWGDHGLSAQDKTDIGNLSGTNTGDQTLASLGAASTSVATTSANGLMSSTDKTKLDAIESGADVTDAVNVSAAGGMLKAGSETSTAMKGFETNLSNQDDWQNSPVSILERDQIGTGGNGADKYAPNLNFHWRSRVSNSLWMNSGGILFYGSYGSTGVPAGADGTFKTGTLYAGTESITATKVGNWNTAYGWGDHGLSAQDKVDIGNLSGTNTGDQVLPTLSSLGALSTSGGAMTGTMKVTGSIIHEFSSAGGYVPFPKGAMYTTATNAHTGAIRIKTPVRSVYDMVKFVVEIFDYSANESVTINIGGYINGGDNQWVNQTVVTIADSTSKDYAVRFGVSDDKATVYIGETDSTWSYPQVIVRDFYAGFNGDIDRYDDDWSIDFVTSFDSVEETYSNNLPASDWNRMSSKPSTFAPIIGTTSTTALAGNTSLFDGAYSSLSGTPTLGTAAAAATTDFATAAQGTKADNAAPKDYESIADLGSPDAISGTWTNASTTDWGTPRIGSSTAKFTDSTGYIQFDIPDGMKSAYLSQLTWSSGGYFHIHGIQSDGGAVLLRVVNSRNAVENSNEANPNQHDGSTTVFAGTGLDNYSAIRITNKSGRLHLTGLGFTSSTVQGAEGMGLIHPSQLSTALSYNSLINLPTLGTAAAAATTDFATAAQGTLADSALQSLPSHNHNDIYYTEDEIRLALARINGWEAGYSSGTASNVKWNLAEEALELKHDTDTSIGAVYKAVYMEAGETKRFTVMIKGSSPSSNGMYLRLYQHDGNLPNGKTHVSNDAQGTFVQEDDRGDTGWYENGAVSNSWTTFEREYKAPANGYVSLVVLNWTGVGLESLFIKTPDIQTVYAVVESGSIGISQLAVSDGTTGQVLTTNGSGTLSFSTVTSGGSDTNYYLDGITRTDSTNTLVFSVSGATNQSFTFGANAFNSTTIPAAEAYTAHEDTSTLSGVYGDTANGTKIDTITVDANGHITAVATGATGNMTGFFVEDGDGTEVQINNANEWKFVEGTGININWSDTTHGSDTDPYDLTFSLKDNSVSATQLNVSGNGTAGQVLASDGDGTFSWVADANTDTVYTHPTGDGNNHIPTGGAAGQFLRYSSSGVATWATPSYTTNTNTTYSAGTGLDLTSTTFSVEPDLRDGITHVGKDANNYIQFDSTNGRIDFYAGGVFVARMESDGDLHIKGDVIAFSDIFG